MRKVYLLTSHSIAKFQSVSFARKMAEMAEVAALRAKVAELEAEIARLKATL